MGISYYLEEMIKATVLKLNIHYDEWFSEAGFMRIKSG